MHIENAITARTQCFHYLRSKRDVRHEVSVHYVEMEPVSAGSDDISHLLSQTREIGCQD
jgi:hypothetical protein